MTTIEILKKARELLSDPARWCQNKYKDGDKRCMAGALAESAGCNILPAVDDALEAIEIKLEYITSAEALRLEHIPTFNDAPERTHAEILQRFDEAIARLEAAG